mmetsp:Transcript_7586/g.12015  ORF Transcript_7586/g.12015 Transcript_7586/m.12015 type:complete len:221 (-) Transcript_7586:90-752(-)
MRNIWICVMLFFSCADFPSSWSSRLHPGAKQRAGFPALIHLLWASWYRYLELRQMMDEVLGKNVASVPLSSFAASVGRFVVGDESVGLGLHRLMLYCGNEQYDHARRVAMCFPICTPLRSTQNDSIDCEEIPSSRLQLRCQWLLPSGSIVTSAERPVLALVPLVHRAVCIDLPAWQSWYLFLPEDEVFLDLRCLILEACCSVFTASAVSRFSKKVFHSKL